MADEQGLHFRPGIISISLILLMASFILSPLITRSKFAPHRFLTSRRPRPESLHPTVVRNMASTVSPASAHSLMQGEAPPTYLDVRTPEEFKAGHAPAAVNVPVTMGSGPLPNFVGDVGKLFTKDAPLIVGCKSGKRSTMAINLLKEAGYENLVEVEGGFDAWKEDSNLPTEQ